MPERRIRWRWTVQVVVLVGAAWVAGLPWAEARVALVVGNSAYQHTEALTNPSNDAADMAAELRGLGFEVIEGRNLTMDGFYEHLGEFSEALHRAKQAEAALFFYAGHGMQDDKAENYLVPVDVALKGKWSIRKMVPLDDVMEVMEEFSGLKLVFLDACRDNPLGGTRSVGGGGRRGLAPARIRDGGAPGGSSGTVIVYATEPNDTADDGEGRNSPFTGALLAHIGTPGLEVDAMLDRVTGTVKERTRPTGKVQVPWVSKSKSGPFYFVSGDGGTGVGGSGPPPDPLPSSSEARVAYGLAEKIHTRAAYEAITTRFPRTVYAQLAKAQIEKLAGGDGEVRPEPPSAEKPEADARLSAELGGIGGGFVGAVGVGRKFRDCEACPELVVVPAGSFMMGSPLGEAGRRENEGPVHRVEIPEPLAVGVYEVTRGKWSRFAEETGHPTGDSCRTYEEGEWNERSGRSWRTPGYAQTEEHPVVCVSWEDARAYVGWLSRKTGKGYRLLSESEWEYVARGGTRTSRYWGDGESGQCRYGNGADGSAKRRYSGWTVASCDDGHVHTSPVGRFVANGYGLHDVAGNVWEWVEDCWHGSYEGAPSDGRAWRSGGDCGPRVMRGGSWGDIPGYLRSAIRGGNTTDYRVGNAGLRVARTLD